MENRKNKIWVIAFISILSLTTGYRIAITRNQYYGYPVERDKKGIKCETIKNCPANSLTNTRNGQN